MGGGTPFIPRAGTRCLCLSSSNNSKGARNGGTRSAHLSRKAGGERGGNERCTYLGAMITRKMQNDLVPRPCSVDGKMKPTQPLGN